MVDVVGVARVQLMDRPERLNAAEIRTYYAQAIRESDEGRLNYLTFYGWLRDRGLVPKGEGHKEKHRSIYNAVTGRKDFEKVAPGIFALTDEWVD